MLSHHELGMCIDLMIHTLSVGVGDLNRARESDLSPAYEISWAYCIGKSLPVARSIRIRSREICYARLPTSQQEKGVSWNFARFREVFLESRATSISGWSFGIQEAMVFLMRLNCSYAWCRKVMQRPNIIVVGFRVVRTPISGRC